MDEDERTDGTRHSDEVNRHLSLRDTGYQMAPNKQNHAYLNQASHDTLRLHVTKQLTTLYLGITKSPTLCPRIESRGEFVPMGSSII